ncbi:MAG TPA: hypothetical protein H9769_05105 [Candidatus Microbacterium pullistercoris]|nr:hypothetical protein [Candidatus Microbacterium pullistercoris]
MTAPVSNVIPGDSDRKLIAMLARALVEDFPSETPLHAVFLAAGEDATGQNETIRTFASRLTHA